MLDACLQSVCKLHGKPPETVHKQVKAYMLAPKESWKKYVNTNSAIGTKNYKAGSALLYQCLLDVTSKLQSKIVSMKRSHMSRMIAL